MIKPDSVRSPIGATDVKRRCGVQHRAGVVAEVQVVRADPAAWGCLLQTHMENLIISRNGAVADNGHYEVIVVVGAMGTRKVGFVRWNLAIDREVLDPPVPVVFRSVVGVFPQFVV